MVSQTVWHCKITAKLGGYGMGVTYKAQVPKLNKHLEYKCLVYT